MAQTTMYPGVNNSPQTTLSASITGTDTTIAVTSIGGLPGAPNIVTIGADDDAELVRYNGISGLELTGCERGFNGTTAKIWPRDELVYRGFTEYDYEALRLNVGDLETNKLAEAGDGSNVTAVFTAAASKANIATGEKLSVIFGKLSKWFSSFGGAAWLNIGTTAGTVAAGNHSHSAADVGADAAGAANAAVTGHNENSQAHSERFNEKSDKPTLATTLPASGTALADNTEYRPTATVGTYVFAVPTGNHDIWIRFTTAATIAISYATGIVDKGPVFEASKTYEISIKDGIVIGQEVSA